MLGFKPFIFWKTPHLVPSNIKALLPDWALPLTEKIEHPFPTFHPLVPSSKLGFFSKFFELFTLVVVKLFNGFCGACEALNSFFSRDCLSRNSFNVI